jgi:crotonobetainyl-CoA:carnitine CoA-transferase CaiB-like acyl-CoA transferase
METKTKAELFDAAITRGVLLCPVNTIEDVVESPQLESREFWQQVEHPELCDTITYPGSPIKLSEDACPPLRRAPLIGEHNQEVYEKELGFSKEQLVTLKTSGVI